MPIESTRLQFTPHPTAPFAVVTGVHARCSVTFVVHRSTAEMPVQLSWQLSVPSNTQREAVQPKSVGYAEHFGAQTTPFDVDTTHAVVGQDDAENVAQLFSHAPPLHTQNCAYARHSSALNALQSSTHCGSVPEPKSVATQPAIAAHWSREKAEQLGAHPAAAAPALTRSNGMKSTQSLEALQTGDVPGSCPHFATQRC